MRGLTIIVAEAAPARLRTALLLALAQAALGGEARVFLDGGAVGALRLPVIADDDALHAAAGQPGMAALVEDAFDAGIMISLCQTGMQLAGADAGAFDPRCECNGMVGLLATLGDDRLVAL